MTEVLLQAPAFAGFPRAVSAAEQLNRLFDEAGLASTPAPTPRALLRLTVQGDQVGSVTLFKAH
jgi:4-carboxymuconolactone decarboxylase